MGSVLVSSWAPRALQKSTQVAHAGHGEPQPLGFQNMSPALGESTIFTLLASQDGTNIGPRSPQVGLKTVVTCHGFASILRSLFGRLWAPFWRPLGPPGRSKNPPWAPRAIQKSTQVAHPGRGGHQGPSQDRPRPLKTPPETPNTPQEDQK